jgi:hypothetical protein
MRGGGPGTAATVSGTSQSTKRATDTTTGLLAPQERNDFGLKLVNWRPHRRGRLRGFAVVEFGCGLIIDGIAVFVGKDGIARGQLPTHPRVEEGQVVKHLGEVQYTSNVYWNNPRVARAWAVAVGTLVRREYPEDFD